MDLGVLHLHCVQMRQFEIPRRSNSHKEFEFHFTTIDSETCYVSNFFKGAYHLKTYVIATILFGTFELLIIYEII